MREGCLQQAAEPQTLYDRPANRYVASLLGNPGMNFLGCRVEVADGRCVCCLAESIRFPLPERSRAAIEPYAGKSITLGVRPEHVRLAEEESVLSTQCSGLRTHQPAPNTQHSVVIPATVEGVERLGAESLVYLKTEEIAFIARAENGVRTTIGEHVRARALPEHLHFFDAESGRAIRS
jgi:multiple sugar transport system ATP-binding protein